MLFLQYPVFNAQSLIENVVNAFSNKTVATKEVIEQALEQTYQNTIAYSVNGLLSQYPTVEYILNALSWAVNHLILSAIIVVFILALLWSLVKAIVGLIERASQSLLRIPFLLLFNFFKVSLKSFGQVGGFAVQKFIDTNTSNAIATVSQPITPTKQQRLTEITYRLEELQKEQTILMKEVAELMGKEVRSGE